MNKKCIAPEDIKKRLVTALLLGNIEEYNKLIDKYGAQSSRAESQIVQDACRFQEALMEEMSEKGVIDEL